MNARRLKELLKHAEGELKLKSRRRDFFETLDEWFSEAEKEGNSTAANAFAAARLAITLYTRPSELTFGKTVRMAFSETLEEWLFQAVKEDNDEAVKAFAAGILALSPQAFKNLLGIRGVR